MYSTTNNGKALVNGNVRRAGGAGTPQVTNRSLASTSKKLRILDPLVISAGLISRGDNASATLYGFAMEPSTRTEPAQIATMPFETDPAGLKRISLYPSVAENEFTGQIKFGSTLATSMEGTACDLAPALVSPTPTLSQGGTPGVTTYGYQITAVNLLGESKSLAATNTNTGNAALSATDYNIVTIPRVIGAIKFRIYRGGQFLAEVDASQTGTTTYNDTGAATDSTITPPSYNDTGWVVDPATSSTVVLMITGLVDPVGTVSAPNVNCRVRFKVATGKSSFV